jgi:cytidyltransferase-like protein
MTERRVGYAAGAYDLFHIGHLNLLRHAKSQCDYLIAGVVADEMLVRNKNVSPMVPLAERLEIVSHIDFVDEARAALRRVLQGRRLARHRERAPPRAGVRRGRGRGCLLSVHDVDVEHCPPTSGRRPRRRERPPLLHRWRLRAQDHAACGERQRTFALGLTIDA